MRSPTARTLNFFRKLDCEARVVEQWIGFGKPKGFKGKPGVRRDLWGADILVRQGAAFLAVQSTSGSNHSKRVENRFIAPGMSPGSNINLSGDEHPGKSSGGNRKQSASSGRLTCQMPSPAQTNFSLSFVRRSLEGAIITQ